MLVQSGSGLVGKDERVAILTLSESAAGEFALVFSMSHAVGDWAAEVVGRKRVPTVRSWPRQNGVFGSR